MANLSFAGCGFLGIYHVGVATCFKEYAPQILQDKISGASAGALVACALVTNCCLGECTTFTLKLALDARSRTLGPLSPSFRLVKNLRLAIQNFLPDNAHEIATGRLHVSLTRVSDRKNVIVSEFGSKDELIDALICSSFVPLYSGIVPPTFRGVFYVDGAVSNNVPILDDMSITVSPFAGESDICPDDSSCSAHHINLGGTSIQLTAGNLYRSSVAFFPPSPEILSNMCRQGFDDALRYLTKTNRITCTQHLSIQSAIISSSPINNKLFDNLSITSNSGDQEFDSDSSEEEEEEEEEDEGVGSDCEKMESAVPVLRRAPVPPAQVQRALQEACDKVNRGLLARIYKMRSFQIISLFAVLIFLPWEIFYNVVKRFYEWHPYISDDMRWFVKELYRLARDLLKFDKKNGTKPSRFSIQLSIATERTFQSQTSQRRKKSSIHQPISQPIIDRPSVTYRGPSDLELANAKRTSLDMDFSINIGNGVVDSPLRCVGGIRRHLGIEGSETRRMSVVEDYPLKTQTDATNVGATKVDSIREEKLMSIGCSKQMSAMADSSFDDCLRVVNQMDSILAYYYLDENNSNKVKVIEIFPLQVDEVRTRKKSSSITKREH